MSLIAASIIAAVGLSGSLIAARLVAQRRRRLHAAQSQNNPAAAHRSPRAAQLPVGLGDVVQHDNNTRWPCSGFLMHNARTLHAALWVIEEAGRQLAILVWALPRTEVYWLEKRIFELPPSAPSRLAVDTGWLDRVASIPVDLEMVGLDSSMGDGPGIFSFYEGPAGDAAAIIQTTSANQGWYGKRLEAGDYEVLGYVEPSPDSVDPLAELNRVQV